MADDDDLVALIDGELEGPRESAMIARLASDPVLRRRYEALKATSAPIGAALGLALDSAPVDRLSAFLPAEPPATPLGRPVDRLRLRELAAGVVVGFLAAAALAWFALGGLTRGEEDWRSAVVQYMDLYTKETFAFPTLDVQTRDRELARVGERVGASLTPKAIALPGLDLKAAFLLGYEGSPLGEVAYVDPSGQPVLFCIFLGRGSTDAPIRVERRGGYALASWARDGRNFLVIGRLPDAQIADYARTLEARL